MHSSRQEALLYFFEDNEAVIKMIIKGRSPTMRHVSRTHRVALDWLFDRIMLDPKIQIKYIDTKNQLADILTKGNFTRDEWNHLVCLFNISPFSSINCLAAMSKRTQEGAGEERVTAKSKPMMNLVSQYSVSSLEWKSGDMLGARTERPVGGQESIQEIDMFVIDDDDMDSDTVTESNLPLKSRSFLNRVNDRLRKMLEHSKDAMQDIDKRSLIWESLILQHWKHLCSWERLRKFTSHQKIRKGYHIETHVRHI